MKVNELQLTTSKYDYRKIRIVKYDIDKNVTLKRVNKYAIC